MRPFSGTLSAAAAPRLQDLLGHTPDGPLSVLHTGPRAVYLAVDRPGAGSWCLGVVGARSGRRAQRPASGAARPALAGPGPRPRSRAARSGWASITLRVSRLVDVRIPPLRVAVDGDLDERRRPRRRRGAAATASRRTPTTCSAAGWRSSAAPTGSPPRWPAAVRASFGADHAALRDPARLRAARRGAPGVRGVRPGLGTDDAGPPRGGARGDRGVVRARPAGGRAARARHARGGGMTATMSRTHVELRPGAYADSVALLQVSRRVADQPGSPRPRSRWPPPSTSTC